MKEETKQKRIGEKYIERANEKDRRGEREQKRKIKEERKQKRKIVEDTYSERERERVFVLANFVNLISNRRFQVNFGRFERHD